jgi:anti-sigma-K factor RskA
MEPRMNSQAQRESARVIADADRYIEHILSEHEHELKAFSETGASQFCNVKILVNYERARRYALMNQLEAGHCDCERENIEKVTTWGYAVAVGAIIGTVVLAALGLVHLIAWLQNL